MLFSSCQKEISLDSTTTTGGGTGSGGNGTGNGNTSGDLLVKTVAVTGTETVTSIYTYDGSKRLSTQTESGVSGGMPVNSYKRFERDAAGRIVRVVQKLGDVGGVPSDTARTTYHYPNATTMEPDYSVAVISMGTNGLTMSTIDSSVYNYSGGKLVSHNGYMSTSIMGMVVPVSESRWEYTYNAAGHVSAMKTFTNTSSGDPLTETYNIAFTYGTLANNNYLSASAMQNFILYNMPNTNAPAVTKSVASSNATTPPVNVTISTSFTSTNGKITGGTANVVSTGQPAQNTTYTFYYQ